jgi:hypothetical protein
MFCSCSAGVGRELLIAVVFLLILFRCWSVDDLGSIYFCECIAFGLESGRTMRRFDSGDPDDGRR